MKKAICKVWEITNPANHWREEFEVFSKEDVQRIFDAFNSSLRSNEEPRDYEIIEIY